MDTVARRCERFVTKGLGKWRLWGGAIIGAIRANIGSREV